MTAENNLTSAPIDKASLLKRTLIGAGIGLVLISLFLASVNQPKPEWGKFWIIRPLIVVLLAGACGGAGTYFVYYFFGNQGKWSKIIAFCVSLIGFVIALWLGAILGLDGTLWN